MIILPKLTIGIRRTDRTNPGTIDTGNLTDSLLPVTQQSSEENVLHVLERFIVPRLGCVVEPQRRSWTPAWKADQNGHREFRIMNQSYRVSESTLLWISVPAEEGGTPGVRSGSARYRSTQLGSGRFRHGRNSCGLTDSVGSERGP